MATRTSFEQVSTAIKSGDLKPLYLIYGEEQFRVKQLEQQILNSALQDHERDFNLDIVYSAEAEGPGVLALCNGYPMMAERRVVLVRDFDKLNRKELFGAYGDQPNPTCVVVLTCSGKPNFSRKPFNKLKKSAISVECKRLYQREMAGWIQKRSKQLGYDMESGAAQMLSELTGTEMWTAENELKKLIAYVGERNKLTSEDVLGVSGHSREYNVFELQKAVGAQKYSQAMQIASRMLRVSSNRRGAALMMVSVLTSYCLKLRRLSNCQVKGLPASQVAPRIGVPAYFLKEYTVAVQKMGREGIERAFAALVTADYELKGGSPRSPELILSLLLRRLSSTGAT